MKTITVNASQKYNVIIGEGLLADAGKLCAEAIGICRGVVITDSTVDKLYSDKLIASLENVGYQISKFVFESGEVSKNTNTFVDILEFLAECELTRSDCIFALGGGVVGDISGFAAATYLRGIRFVQFPTTLLAAVDSSVGGKTGIDLKAGKNLAGAFHQPALVVCDYTTLDTLTSEIFADGCAEVIKYGIINDKELFNILKLGFKNNIEDIIARCVANKRDIVEADEFDNGKRQLLNLGHTLAHSIEKLSNFSISHGSAVAIGMVIVSKISYSDNNLSKDSLKEIISLIESADLPTECNYTAHELASVALSDKKRKGDKITLIIPYDIGDSRLVPVDVNKLQEIIEKGL